MQSRSQLQDIVREEHLIRQSTPDFVVEVQNEDFIVRITLFDEGLRRGENVGSLWRHAEALIHENAHGNRDIIMSECRNPLWPAIFRDGEIALRQPGNKTAFAIFHAHIHEDQANVATNGEVGLLLYRTRSTKTR